jgi:hypothetical protein
MSPDVRNFVLESDFENEKIDASRCLKHLVRGFSGSRNARNLIRIPKKLMRHQEWPLIVHRTSEGRRFVTRKNGQSVAQTRP